MMRGGRNRNKPQVKMPYFAFDGGLNLVDPPLSTPDGMLLGVSNYELLVRGGYRRIDGHERFDGQPAPSEGTYWTLPFDAGLVEPSIGDIVVGQTSIARGRVVAIQLDSGSWGVDAAGFLIIWLQDGIFFIDDEDLVSGHSAFSIGFDAGFE